MASTNILVVGDWLVDEYWLLGEQRSSFSRRRGLRHTLALHSPDASIRTLGGAGMVASILAQMKYVPPGSGPAEEQFNVLGLGRWHPEDGDAIMHLLCAASHREQTHYRLTFPGSPSAPPNVSLHLIAKAEPAGGPTERVPPATTRVIRLYHRRESQLELLQRIDWELETTEGPEGTVEIPKIPEDLSNDVKHVVFLDLGKGVVTTPLAEEICSRYPQAAWYVFSKSFKPRWLSNEEHIRNRIRLFFIPETAATQAMRGRESPGWITAPRKVPSQDAVKVLQELQDQYPHACIVVMPRGISLLLALKGKDDTGKGDARKDDRAFVQPDDSLPPHGDLIPMATVMFPTLIGHQIALPDNLGTKDGHRDLVARALAFTYHWMKNEGERFSQPWFRPKSQQVCKIEASRTLYCEDQGGTCQPVGEFRKLDGFSLEDASQEWDQAFRGLGIVKVKANPGRRVFQLWRATTNVGDYVTCVPYKRRILQDLVRIAREFKSQHERRHTSLLLIDNPGSGKSYLVECLARELSIRRLEFNITQLLDRADLLHCFDTIVTSQAQGPHDPLLVFFDEINANLDGNHVYDSFLAPLEQGVYVRSGNRFHIQPCLWVFAGTHLPQKAETGAQRDRPDKMSDFISRLTHPPFDLSGADPRRGKRVEDLEKLERIYVAIATLRSAFGDVTHVSEAVFTILKSLKDDMGPRAIRQFVRSFKDVQRGRVTIPNLPDDWWKYTAYQESEAKPRELELQNEDRQLVLIEF